MGFLIHNEIERLSIKVPVIPADKSFAPCRNEVFEGGEKHISHKEKYVKIIIHYKHIKTRLFLYTNTAQDPEEREKDYKRPSEAGGPLYTV